MADTYNPILGTEDIKHGFIPAKVPPAAPGVIIVLSGAGPLAISKAGDRLELSWQEIRRYNHMTRVDASEHLLVIQKELPSKVDGIPFLSTVELTCIVCDAKVVVERKIQDARRVIEPIIFGSLRRISSAFEYTSRIEAERVLTDALRTEKLEADLFQSGFRIDRGVVSLEMDTRIVGVVTKQVDTRNRLKINELEHELAKQKQRFTIDTRNTEIASLLPHLQDGKMKMLTLKYMQTGNIDDVIDQVNQDEVNTLTTQLHVLELLAKTGGLEGRQVDEAGRALLREMLEGLAGRSRGSASGNAVSGFLSEPANANAPQLTTESAPSAPAASGEKTYDGPRPSDDLF